MNPDFINEIKTCKTVKSFNKTLKKYGLHETYEVTRLLYWSDPRPTYGLWRYNTETTRWNLLEFGSIKELSKTLIFYLNMKAR